MRWVSDSPPARTAPPVQVAPLVGGPAPDFSATAVFDQVSPSTLHGGGRAGMLMAAATAAAAAASVGLN